MDYLFLLFSYVPSCLLASKIGLHPILMYVAPSGLWCFVFTLCLCVSKIGLHPILMCVAPSGLWYFVFFTLCLRASKIGLHPILWDVAPSGLWYFVLFYSLPSYLVAPCLNDRASPYPDVCRPFRAMVFCVFLLFAFVPRK